jgi:hypothetical protein
LADKHISIIVGVGERYSALLGEHIPPISTVGELANVDPDTEISGVSREKILELKAAAELILADTFEGGFFVTLDNYSLAELTELTVCKLASRVGQSTRRARWLQRRARTLMLLLNNKAFSELKVKDLLLKPRNF